MILLIISLWQFLRIQKIKLKFRFNFCLLIQEGSKSSKILHLTDIHLDLGYKVGSNSDCSKPLCCTNDTEMAETAETAAGYWGSYSCDVPVWTFEDMLVQIREKHLDVSAILSHV